MPMRAVGADAVAVPDVHEDARCRPWRRGAPDSRRHAALQAGTVDISSLLFTLGGELLLDDLAVEAARSGRRRRSCWPGCSRSVAGELARLEAERSGRRGRCRPACACRPRASSARPSWRGVEVSAQPMPAAPTTAGSGGPERCQVASAGDLRSKVCSVAFTEVMSGTVTMMRRVARCSGRGQ